MTEFNKYYVYNAGAYVYVSSQSHNKIESVIKNDFEFFKQYGAENLLQQYSISTALKMLLYFYNVKYREIETYYGEKWDLHNDPVFTPLQKMNENSIINISDVTKMKYAQIYNLSNYNDILSLNSILKDNSIIYENIAIKLKCEELKTFLLFV